MTKADEKKYEQNMVELNSIIQKMQDGALSMTDYVSHARRAKELLESCKGFLSGLDGEISSIFTENDE